MNRSGEPSTGSGASAQTTRRHRRRARHMKDHRDGVEQRVDVGAECLVVHAHSVAISQRNECVRKLVPVWRGRPVHQDGQNADTTSQSGRDLEDDEVVRVVQAALTVLVAGVEPGTTDDREKHTARGDGLLDRGREISARLDRVDVDEDVSMPETLGQAVIQAAREMPGVLTPVAQKDSVGNTAGRRLRHDRDSTSASAGPHPTSFTRHFCCFCGSGSGALRRVRGRSSQVKGAFGVATRGRCAPPCDLRASATPSGRACGQAGGLPGWLRSAPEPPAGRWPPVKIVE